MTTKKRQTRADVVYHAMCEESAKHCLPERFETDLHTHDRNFLTSKQSELFGWILYPNGTHVIVPDRDMRERTIRERLETVASENAPTPRLYLIEGAHVNETDPETLAYVLSGERDRDRAQAAGPCEHGTSAERYCASCAHGE